METMTEEQTMNLDIGCGGNLIDAPENPTIRGNINIDINKPKKGFHIENFIQCNAEMLPFRDDTFDSVSMYDVIEHLDSPGIAMKEIARILKPNGIAEIGTPNALWIPKIVRAAFKGIYAIWPNHVVTWGGPELKQLCERVGLEVYVEYSNYPKTPIPIHYQILVWLCPFRVLKNQQLIAKARKP